MGDSETIEQLQNIVRLREKEIQDKDAKFSKLKLQMKAKLVSLNKELEEAKTCKSGPGVAELTKTTESPNESSTHSEESSVEISPTPSLDSSNNNSINTKVVLRHKLEGKELEVKQLMRKLEEKEGLVQGRHIVHNYDWGGGI